MKGFKIAGVILIVMLIINIYFYFFVQTTTQEVLEITHLCINNINDSDFISLKENIDILDKRASELNPIWQLIINHSETDEINVAIKHLKGAYEYDKNMCIVYLQELTYHVDNIYQRERMSRDNIF